MKTKVDKAPNHVAEAPVLENIDILREEVQKHAATCLSCDSQNRDTKCFEKVKGIIIRSIPENRISTIKNQK